MKLKSFVVIGALITGTIFACNTFAKTEIEQKHKCSWEVIDIRENRKTDILQCSECGKNQKQKHVHDFKVVETKGKIEYLYCECGCNETNIKEHKWETIGHDGDKELIQCSICGCNETRR